MATGKPKNNTPNRGKIKTAKIPRILQNISDISTFHRIQPEAEHKNDLLQFINSIYKKKIPRQIRIRNFKDIKSCILEWETNATLPIKAYHSNDF